MRCWIPRLDRPAAMIAALLALPGAPALAEAATAPSHRASLAESFFIQRNASGGGVEVIGTGLIWILLALSVACVALITRLWLENLPGKIYPVEQAKRTRQLVRDRRHRQALDELNVGTPSFFAEVTRAALGETSHGHAAMLRAGELAAEEQSVHRLRRIEPLNVLGNVAPMIGLFGTVYGIILAFREIVSSGGTPDPVGLAAGIGTALVSTFWGLVVAIPAMSAYGVLRNRIEGATVEACRMAEQIVNDLRPAVTTAEVIAPRAHPARSAAQEEFEPVLPGAR